ncbi:MAG: hypothetical protein ACI978_002809, partial [Oleispira sp.]
MGRIIRSEERTKCKPSQQPQAAIMMRLLTAFFILDIHF